MTTQRPATPDTDQLQLEALRAATAIALQASLLRNIPGARSGGWQTTKDGFTVDIAAGTTLKQESLKPILSGLKALARQKIEISETPTDRRSALEQLEHNGQPLRASLLRDLPAETQLHQIHIGPDVDFVPATSPLLTAPPQKLGALKLDNISGVYWQGNSKNEQLQRLRFYCHRTPADIDAAIRQNEQDRQNDHREINVRQHLFAYTQPEAVGMLSWKPRGETIRQEIQHLAAETEQRAGYQRVSTPILAEESLYHRSGHLPYYADGMYPPMKLDAREMRLRPMNCPHHHLLAGQLIVSPRDLPLRIAEHGLVHRYEASGTVNGLMRARGFTQNDAHIYCTPDQVESEMAGVLKMHQDYYDLFGIKSHYISLALPDPSNKEKFVDQPKEWTAAANHLRSALEKSGMPYVEEKGEAAFYGPKIDFIVQSNTGHDYTISTAQLDFMAARKFNLMARNNGQETPLYVIHRAPLGSNERFIGFLLEHYSGQLPTWLAPTQATVVPIADRHVGYAHQVARDLAAPRVFNAMGQMRITVDETNERMQKKILHAHNNGTPYILVVGDREAETGTVSVRFRNGASLPMPLDSFTRRIEQEVNTRRDLSLPPPRGTAPA